MVGGNDGDPTSNGGGGGCPVSDGVLSKRVRGDAILLVVRGSVRYLGLL